MEPETPMQTIHRSSFPNVLVADAIAPAGVERLEQSARVAYQPDISPETLKKTIARYDALIVRSRTRVTADLIFAAPKLRVIGRVGVGLDTIATDAAWSRGIPIVNSPSASTVAVAELTLGLMLSLARRIPEADAGMKRGEWLKRSLMGSELSGKTMGIIGLGRIGMAVAQRAAAFGMRLIAFDPYLSSGQINERGAEAANLARLLQESDYLSLHVPLTDDTYGLLGARELAQMKNGANLICCARGKIIDENALADALDAGKLAGAALDVFAVEPPGYSRLVQHPKVIATPHIGAMTREAQEKAALEIVEQVLAVLKRANN
ncbi:MAG TPA: hydroxyacid dehydrogenase [Chloroflexi bacterium]|nr:hydroxyacid dehydrogenase [Chloroflexota bacterium]